MDFGDDSDEEDMPRNEFAELVGDVEVRALKRAPNEISNQSTRLAHGHLCRRELCQWNIFNGILFYS